MTSSDKNSLWLFNLLSCTPQKAKKKLEKEMSQPSFPTMYRWLYLNSLKWIYLLCENEAIIMFAGTIPGPFLDMPRKISLNVAKNQKKKKKLSQTITMKWFSSASIHTSHFVPSLCMKLYTVSTGCNWLFWRWSTRITTTKIATTKKSQEKKNKTAIKWNYKQIICCCSSHLWYLKPM